MIGLGLSLPTRGVLGGLAATFTPLNLGAQLAVWFDGTDTSATSMTMSGSSVSQWWDKSGNARHVTQATGGSQPTYSDTALNGVRPGLLWAGAQGMQNTAISPIVSNPLWTFAVVSLPSAGAANGVVAELVPASGNTGYSQGITLLRRNGGALGVISVYQAAMSNYGQGGSVAMLSTNKASIIASEMISGQNQVWRDGTGQGYVAVTYAGASSVVLAIGHDYPLSGGAAYNGTIAEILIVKPTGGVLSTSDQQKIEGYLAWKHGLRLQLPTNHPYYSSPPNAAFLPKVYASQLTINNRVWGTVTGDSVGTHTTNEATSNKGVDQVNGNNANAGTLASPKKTLAGVGTLANSDVLGLYRNSVWRESLSPSAATGVLLQDISGGNLSTSLPIISGFDTTTNGSWTSNGDGTYSLSWTSAGSLLNDGYGDVLVSEVDTTIEAATPLAARRNMIVAATSAAAIATAGLAYVTGSGTSWTARIHPTDGNAPGTRYRYEVTSRSQPVLWGNTTAGGTLEGVLLYGGSAGYGSLGGPQSFTGDRIVIHGGTTHHAVIGSGSVNRSLFSNPGDNDAFQLAWYTNDPTGLTASVTNSFFYDFASVSPNGALIAHSGGGNSFTSLTISNTMFRNSGRVGGALLGLAVTQVNSLTATITNCYFENLMEPIDPSTADSEISSCLLRKVGRIWPPKRFNNNIVSLQNISDPGNVNNRQASAIQGRNSHTFDSIQNNLFYAENVVPGNGQTDFGLSGWNSPTTSAGAIRGNIVILNVSAASTDAHVAALGALPYTMTCDYNLYVIHSTSGNVTFSANSVTYNTVSAAAANFASYKTATGLDTNSILYDVTNAPNGIKDIFVDPTNGDFRFADTVAGRACYAYCVANNVGPPSIITSWPVIPTADQVAQLIAAA